MAITKKKIHPPSDGAGNNISHPPTDGAGASMPKLTREHPKGNPPVQDDAGATAKIPDLPHDGKAARKTHSPKDGAGAKRLKKPAQDETQPDPPSDDNVHKSDHEDSESERQSAFSETDAYGEEGEEELDYNEGEGNEISGTESNVTHTTFPPPPPRMMPYLSKDKKAAKKAKKAKANSPKKKAKKSKRKRESSSSSSSCSNSSSSSSNEENSTASSSSSSHEEEKKRKSKKHKKDKNAKKPKVVYESKSEANRWSCTDELANHVNYYQRNYLSEAVLAENITDATPPPSNILPTPEIDSKIKHNMKEMKRDIVLTRDRNYATAQNKIHKALGPLTKLWKVAKRDKKSKNNLLEAVTMLGQAQVHLSRCRRINILTTMLGHSKAKTLVTEQEENFAKSGELLFGEEFRKSIPKKERELIFEPTTTSWVSSATKPRQPYRGKSQRGQTSRPFQDSPSQSRGANNDTGRYQGYQQSRGANRGGKSYRGSYNKRGKTFLPSPEHPPIPPKSLSRV